MVSKKNVSIISLDDFDNLVVETYGRPYMFQQQNGGKERKIVYFSVPLNREPYDFKKDTIPEIVNHKEMGVSFKAWLERDPKKLIPGKDEFGLNLWWGRNFYPHFDMILTDLYNKGLIESGDYGIDIDW